MTTIAERFDPRHNSLNAIRLVLAATVIVSHTWPLGGYGPDPSFGDRTLGSVAVAGFFAISGYLITMSRMSGRSATSYFWARFLRIYPAYILALIAVAAVFGPLYSALRHLGGYDWASAGSYVLRNSLLYIDQWGIDGTLSDAHYPITWNGSAWTLFFEAVCYVGISVAVSVVPRRHLTACVAGIGLCCMAVIALDQFAGFELFPDLTFLASVAVFFAAGSLLFLLRDRIVLTGPNAVAAVAFCVGAAAVHVFGLLAALPLAYVMMYLGVALPLRSLGARNDLSYGVYIFAFPVQQLVAAVFSERMPNLLVYMGLCAAVTFALAASSWFLVEKPAMKLKSARPFTKRPDAMKQSIRGTTRAEEDA